MAKAWLLAYQVNSQQSLSFMQLVNVAVCVQHYPMILAQHRGAYDGFLRGCLRGQLARVCMYLMIRKGQFAQKRPYRVENRLMGVFKYMVVF